MTATSRRVRLLFGAAALAASLPLSLVACSDSSSKAPATTGASGTTAPATGSTVAATVPADPTAALQQGVTLLDAGYHFTATVTINGAVTLSAEGDRVGATSRLSVTSSGATVDYVITGDANYAKPADGDWQQLETAPATADPIAALRSPVSVTADIADDGSVVLTVTVTAASVGIQADGNVVLLVTLTGEAITRLSYDATVQGGTANVTNVITPLVDTTPITAPTV